MTWLRDQSLYVSIEAVHIHYWLRIREMKSVSQLCQIPSRGWRRHLVSLTPIVGQFLGFGNYKVMNECGEAVKLGGWALVQVVSWVLVLYH